MSERLTTFLFVFAVLYLTLFYQLGTLPFIGADEPRYARVSEEMYLSNDYVTPRLEGRPWLEKPPLLFWLQAASFRFFGVSEATARLPVALCAVFLALITAWFTGAASGSRAGLLALMIIATSGLFFLYGRAGSTDMPLAAAFSAALILSFEASRGGSVGLAVASGLTLGLATLAKGPVALLLFCGVWLIYSLLDWKWPWSWKQALPGGLAFLVMSVPWFWLAWKANGANFVATFWLNHNLARFLTSIHHHEQPFWYYLPVLLLGFFPWICFLPTAAARVTRRSGGGSPAPRYHLFLWVWILVPLVFFSVSQSKLPGYVLLLIPAMAGLAAFELERLLQSDDVLVYRSIGREVWVMVVLGALIATALALGFRKVYEATSVGMSLCLPLALALGVALYSYWRRRFLSMILGLVAGFTLFAAVAYWMAAPVIGDYHSAKSLSQAAVPLISEREPLILYRYFHHSALYYTGYRSTREQVVGRQALGSYFEAHPQAKYVILTQKPGWQELSGDAQARLIRHQGNLYLAQVEPPAGAKQAP